MRFRQMPSNKSFKPNSNRYAITVGLILVLGGTTMHPRNSQALFSALALATLAASFIAGCAHHLGPETEPPRVARQLGLAGCDVSESMRRYQTLDYADLIGNPKLAESREWATAISMMQPGDELRYVHCKSGDNFFGLFRGNSLRFRFGGMLY